MTDVDPRLSSLLEKHGLTLEQLRKVGRPPKGWEGVFALRSALVTDLHMQGTSWAEMIAITGLSNGAIQRLTRAMWNPASRETVRENGIRLGKSWKGRRSVGKSLGLKAAWAAGTFDFHRGRIRSEKECQRLRDGWTPQHRQVQVENSLRNWSDPVIRAKIMAFHHSPEEQERKSRLQVQRLKDHPCKYLSGRAECVVTPKGLHERAYARSSYEVAAIRKLETEPTVLRYEHERVLRIPNGHWILPDFIVEYEDAHVVLVEVKAAWVLKQPKSSRVIKRLALAEDFARSQGWGFDVWTERELRC